MIFSMTKRMVMEIDKRVLWKFAWNCGYKGMRSIQKFKKRLKKGVCFPPFVYMSITNACQLRCQGCWVDVDRSQQMMTAGEINGVIKECKPYGNSLLGLSAGSRFCIRSCLRFWRRIGIVVFRCLRMGI